MTVRHFWARTPYRSHYSSLPPPYLLGLFLLGIALWACGGDGGGNGGPTDPPAPTVASVTLSDPADTLLAVGNTLQLSAQAKNAQGGVISGAQISWASTNGGVATVSSGGLVSGVGSGVATITARSGSASGTVQIRVLSVNRIAISANLGDPFIPALVAELTTARGGAVQSRITTCLSQASGGTLSGLVQSFIDLRSELAQSGETADEPLVAVLALLIDESYGLLGL